MSISAIAKRRLALRKADGTFITVTPGEFVNLPEEVEKDPMFKWAVSDGSLVVSQQVIVKAPELPKQEASVDTEPAEEEVQEEEPVEEAEEPVEEKPAKGKKGKGKK